MTEINRRQFGALALGGAGVALGLAACGTSGGNGGGSGSSAEDAYKKATLIFAWWGNDVRNPYTMKLIDDYEKKHSKITIKPQPGEWSSYWTKLSTQVAGNTAPDIIQMDQAYIAEYGGRGALLDLSKQGALKLGDIPKDAQESGTYNGKLFGIPTGRNAYAVVADTDLFSSLGVDLPDDSTWTWDDYQQLASTITQKSGGAVHGTSWVGQDSDLQLWLKQHGEQLYTKDGKIGFKAGTVKDWFDFVEKLVSSDAMPSPDVYAQDIGQSIEQNLFGTKKAAMTWNWTNQVAALSKATGSKVKLLKIPSVAGSAAKAGMYYKPTMFWSASSRTEHPAQSAAFISWLVNSVEAGKLIMAERGMPTNPKVLKAIQGDFSSADEQSRAFLEEIEPDVKWTPPVPPKGTSTVTDIVRRHLQNVMFKKNSSTDAAEALTGEVKDLL